MLSVMDARVGDGGSEMASSLVCRLELLLSECPDPTRGPDRRRVRGP